MTNILFWANYKDSWLSSSSMVKLMMGKPSDGSMVSQTKEIKQKYLADRNIQIHQVFVVIKWNKYFPENIWTTENLSGKCSLAGYIADIPPTPRDWIETVLSVLAVKLGDSKTTVDPEEIKRWNHISSPTRAIFSHPSRGWYCDGSVWRRILSDHDIITLTTWYQHNTKISKIFQIRTNFYQWK